MITKIRINMRLLKLFLSLLLLSNVCLASPEDNKVFIKELFTNVIEETDIKKINFDKYFAPEYKQYVDNKIFNYTDFIYHMQAQKKIFKSIKVKFVHMIAEDDKVATVHEIKAIKKDNNEVEGKVVALFQIKNGKLILCDELTNVTKGSKEDRDLGSRQ